MDYTQTTNWLAVPDATDKKVDVFYVYPTIYNAEDPLNMDINDPALRKKLQNLLITQAGVYSPTCNLFAPYYRQMSMKALEGDTDMYQNPHFRIGADDVAVAFAYYLKHFNQGRPFILAGHSQGSMALIDLLRNHFEDEKVRERMIAAYVIGYSVTRDDLKKYPWIKPASGANDTGVVVTYNSQAPGATGSPVLLPGAICINPLSWKTDATPAPASANLGAVFFDDGTGKISSEVPGYAGAAINPKNGALETTPPDELQTGSFPPGVYHVYDYTFWYRNLQANVKERVEAYLGKKQ